MMMMTMMMIIMMLLNHFESSSPYYSRILLREVLVLLVKTNVPNGESLVGYTVQAFRFQHTSVFFDAQFKCCSSIPIQVHLCCSHLSEMLPSIHPWHGPGTCNERHSIYQQPI